MSNLEVRLNITNYNPHPENPHYTVFHFYREDMATYFEELLKKDNIPFESFIEEEGKTIYLFGIKNIYLDKAVKLNYISIGKFRQGFISNKITAVSLIVVVLILIVFAVIGFINS